MEFSYARYFAFIYDRMMNCIRYEPTKIVSVSLFDTVLSDYEHTFILVHICYGLSFTI